jgi:tripeptidyl-peptidase-1
MSATSLFLASILSLAAAGPAAFQTFIVQESLASAPQGFAKVGLAADTTTINLRIALASSDIPGLEKTLLDVSTPSSSNYGNHLSKAEVSNLVMVLNILIRFIRFPGQCFPCADC